MPSPEIQANNTPDDNAEKPSIFRRIVLWAEGTSEGISRVIVKVQNLAQTNYDLGCTMLANGNVKDAIFRFKLVLWLSPSFHAVHYHLGCCYVNLGKINDAIKHLTLAYQHFPESPHARFLLASIKPDALPPEQHPTTMPIDMVSETFNAQAEFYNQMQAANSYKGHVHIANAVAKYLADERNDYTMIDLGCGTGLMGQMLHHRLRHLVGIDASSDMATIARSLHNNTDTENTEENTATSPLIYNEVIAQDISNWFASAEDASADIIIAAQLLPYLGECDMLFSEGARMLKPGGLLVISYTPFIHDQGFGLMSTTGRYGHSDALVRAQLERTNLSPLTITDIASYPNKHEQLLIAKK